MLSKKTQICIHKCPDIWKTPQTALRKNRLWMLSNQKPWMWTPSEILYVQNRNAVRDPKQYEVGQLWHQGNHWGNSATNHLEKQHTQCHLNLLRRNNMNAWKLHLGSENHKGNQHAHCFLNLLRHSHMNDCLKPSPLVRWVPVLDLA